jgi:hypothetical protein
MGLRLTGAVVCEEKKRDSPPVSVVNVRDTTDETTYRVEVRRAVSQTVTGALSYLHSDRDGSGWIPLTETGGGAALSSVNAPLNLANRKLDTTRLTVNRMPTDPLSFNFQVDESRDKYDGIGDVVNDYDVGPNEGRSSNYSVDGAYSFSDKLTGTAWYSRNDNRYKNDSCRLAGQTNTCQATTNNPVRSADLRNIANSYGLGLRGTLSAKISSHASSQRRCYSVG